MSVTDRRRLRWRCTTCGAQWVERFDGGMRRVKNSALRSCEVCPRLVLDEGGE